MAPLCFVDSFDLS